MALVALVALLPALSVSQPVSLAEFTRRTQRLPHETVSFSPWEKEVIYQIFPRSFYDSNGDHVGDLKGITQKLSFIRNLGATALLINPIFSSPFYHNYFADDFMKVDPSLGTNTDFFDLVHKAHGMGIKVILDVEMQYVTDRNVWFKAAARDRHSPYASYIWRQGSALFGLRLPMYNGISVGYATLNPDSQGVKSAVLAALRYWAAPDGNPKHGVDGFRIDHMMDDLDSQHEKTGLLRAFWLPMEQNLRALNSKIFFLAEQADWKFGANLFQQADVDAVYAIPLRFLWTTLDKAKIERALMSTATATPATKTQVVFIENHDVERYASVVKSDPALLRLGAVFDLTVKGTPLIYYGQELGMAGIQGNWKTDGNDIPVRLAYRWTAKVRGPGSADFYRDTGPWDRTDFVHDFDGVSVEEEAHDPKSLLNFYKSLIHLRKRSPALSSGSMRLIETNNPAVLAYERTGGGRGVRVFLNLSGGRQYVFASAREPSDAVLLSNGYSEDGALGPHGFVILGQP